MVSTVTVEFQEEQNRLAKQTMRAAGELWGLLNINDLDGSTPAWLVANMRLLNASFKEAVKSAQSYIRELEDTASVEPGKLATPQLTGKRTAGELMLNGPIRVKQNIKQGFLPDDAYRKSAPLLLSRSGWLTLNGGRDTIVETVKRSSTMIGWRRVTDGNPCSFCAMLAGRGPVYRSESSARGARRYHRFCGCTVEPLFTEPDLDKRERVYADAYTSAVKSVRADGLPLSAANIQRVMRDSGSFSDSPINV